MDYYIYMVKCKDETLYTGISKDVVNRVHQHNNTCRGAKSLRAKRPVTLVYQEYCGTLSDALKREREIKGWSRIKKLNLIESETNELVSKRISIEE